jgi:hypothetical protein
MYVNLRLIAIFMIYCQTETIVSKQKWWLQIQPLPKSQERERTGGGESQILLFCRFPGNTRSSVCFSFTCRNILWSARASLFSRFYDHTRHTHTTFGRTSLGEWSAQRRDLYVNQNTHKRETSVPRRIRTRNPSKRAAVQLLLRPRGHWEQQSRLLAN